MLVSVKKTPEDMRVVLGAWLLGLPAEFSRTEALESAKEFLSEEGAWLSEIPEAILGAAIEEGLLEVLGLWRALYATPRGAPWDQSSSFN